MANIATDSFTGTNGTELATYSASWVRHSGSASGVNAIIANNRVRGSAAGSAMYYHTATPPSADYSVSADIYEASNPAAYAAGVVGRLDTSAATGYMLRHQYSAGGTNDAWQLWRFVANSFTQLGSNSADPITTGTSARGELRMSGTTIAGYARGGTTPVISVTDSTITAVGKAGIRLGYSGSDAPTDSTLYHLDNFSVDTLGAGVSLQGDAQAQATAAGALSVGIPLAGAAAAQASASGGLTLSVPLSGAAVAQALASAGLSLGVGLAGDAQAQAGASGDLTLNVTLSGAAIAQAAATGNLTATSGASLAGDAQAQASATGALSVSVPLAGAALTVANASGSLTQIVPLAGAAAAASLATGGLDVAVTLSGAALVEALATGALDVTASAALAGDAAAVASASGTLTLRINLSGDAIAQATASGALAADGLITSGTPDYRLIAEPRAWALSAPRDWTLTAYPRSWRLTA